MGVHNGRDMPPTILVPSQLYPKRECSGDVAMSKVLIGSQILCGKVKSDLS